MAIPIETWYYDVPIVTRLFATGAALVALAVVTHPFFPSKQERRSPSFTITAVHSLTALAFFSYFPTFSHQQTGFTNAFQLYFNYQLVFYQHQVGPQSAAVFH